MIFGSIGLKRNIRLLVTLVIKLNKMNEVRCQDFLSRNNFLVPVSPVFPRSHKNVPAFPNMILLLFFALVISKNYCATHGPSFKKIGFPDPAGFLKDFSKDDATHLVAVAFLKSGYQSILDYLSTEKTLVLRQST